MYSIRTILKILKKEENIRPEPSRDKNMQIREYGSKYMWRVVAKYKSTRFLHHMWWVVAKYKKHSIPASYVMGSSKI